MIRNRLKILLAEKNLNYTKLSEMTGISINALSKMGKKLILSPLKNCSYTKYLRCLSPKILSQQGQ